MIGLDGKLGHWIAVVGKLSTCDLNTHSESLNETKVSHGFRNTWVSIVRDAGLAKVFDGDLSKGTTGVLNLDAIVEPRDSHGCVGSFIITVHDRVSQQLLQCRDRIVRVSNFYVGDVTSVAMRLWAESTSSTSRSISLSGPWQSR